MLHYTAPPVVGGVESVMDAHGSVFLQMDYPVTIIAGRGDVEALPSGSKLELIPEMDSQHPDILRASAILESGQVPDNFNALKESLKQQLMPLLAEIGNLIVHNIFTKHFNLPLTAALCELLDEGVIHNCIAWHHDFTWTSKRSRDRVHPGYPWDLLRTYREDVTHVTISEQRQATLVALYECSPKAIRVVYNGVSPVQILNLTKEGWALVQRLDLLGADLLLLMPVRVTRAKNIEYALQVIGELKREGWHVKLVLTGPPDPHDENSMIYFRSLQDMRDEMGLRANMQFVFESGPDPDEGYLIPLEVVADLYRLADLMFMPSHQEGFGMPVLEAGMVGLPVAASVYVPAAQEIGEGDLFLFDPEQDPRQLALELSAWISENEQLNLARRTRQNYTWQAIFRHNIEPLLNRK